MQKKVQIMPSILSADFGALNNEIASVEPYADLISVDVMDGHFVPNISFGIPIVESIRPYTKLPIECHLMITNPEDFIEKFAKAGADIISVHFEITQQNTKKVLNQITNAGAKASLAIKPQTQVSEIEEFLSDLDAVVVMSVEPGFGGQSFLPSALPKIQLLRKLKPNLDIIVDGGINEQTAKDCILAGANILVAGSYVFKSANRKQAIESLKNL